MTKHRRTLLFSIFITTLIIFPSCNPKTSSDEPPVNTSQTDLLLEGAKEGDLQKVKDAIGSGADVNYKDKYYETAIMYAAYNNSDHIVDYLLTQNVAQDSRDELANYRQLETPANYEDPHIRDYVYVWKIIKSRYSFLEYKNIDWDSVYKKYYIQATQLEDSQIETLLMDMLSVLKDGHVFFKNKDNQWYLPFTPPRRETDQLLFSHNIVQAYFDQPLKITSGGLVRYGKTASNIGYVYIENFRNDSVINSIPIWWDDFKNTKGIIFDVRHNTGGNFLDTIAVPQLLLTATLPSIQYYSLGAPKYFPDIQPNPDKHYSKPVVVLINGVTYSSGEWFAEIMKQIDSVTLMGTTTGGGSGGTSGDTGIYFLPISRIKLWASSSDLRKYDGKPWEDVGITPDIEVVQPEDFALLGMDKQLEAALEFLDK